MPLHARTFAAVVVGYAFSPIDLIPDPIPLAECREKSRAAVEGRPVNRVAGVVVVTVWLVLAALAVYLLARIS